MGMVDEFCAQGMICSCPGVGISAYPCPVSMIDVVHTHILLFNRVIYNTILCLYKRAPGITFALEYM